MAASPSELNTTDFPNIASVRHSRSWVVGNLGAALDVSDEQEREESDEVPEAQGWNESQERLIPSIVSHNPLWEGLAAGLERPPASGLEDITTRGRALSLPNTNAEMAVVTCAKALGPYLLDSSFRVDEKMQA
ncbi:hypothetical protein EIP86_000607 [Pleurotus ostreatoroseus]|nr:hypothetical protein EIP86_000607 [Pleurotus ostreatoroseus]